METSNYSIDEIHVAVYMDRHRGSISSKNAFAVYKDLRGITWYVEPVNKCRSYEDVIIGHALLDEDLLLGGILTTDILEVCFLRVNTEDLYKLVAKAFGQRHQSAPYLPQFVNARIRIGSSSLDIGTIRDVINKLQSFS